MKIAAQLSFFPPRSKQQKGKSFLSYVSFVFAATKHVFPLNLFFFPLYRRLFYLYCFHLCSGALYFGTRFRRYAALSDWEMEKKRKQKEVLKYFSFSLLWCVKTQARRTINLAEVFFSFSPPENQTAENGNRQITFSFPFSFFLRFPRKWTSVTISDAALILQGSSIRIGTFWSSFVDSPVQCFFTYRRSRVSSV